MALVPAVFRRPLPGFSPFRKPSRALSAGVPLAGGNPSGFILEDTASKGWYLWFDTNGNLRVADALTVETAGFNFNTGGMGLTGKQAVFDYPASGALIVAGGLHKLSKAGVDVMTLVPPVAAEEGTIMMISAQTANAHTVTLTEGFNNGGAATDVATFGGAVGDNMVIQAVNLHWQVMLLRNVVLA